MPCMHSSSVEIGEVEYVGCEWVVVKAAVSLRRTVATQCKSTHDGSEDAGRSSRRGSTAAV